MSKITQLYDAMITRVETVLPNHKRLGNPYKPDENNEVFLKLGYGVTIGPGENSNRVLTGRISIRRRMSVVLTRKYSAVEHDGEKKAVTEKLLLEDALLIIDDLNQNRTLGGVVVDTRYQSDDGIEYVLNEKDRFLMIRTAFEVEYFEPVNC